MKVKRTGPMAEGSNLTTSVQGSKVVGRGSRDRLEETRSPGGPRGWRTIEESHFLIDSYVDKKASPSDKIMGVFSLGSCPHGNSWQGLRQ